MFLPPHFILFARFFSDYSHPIRGKTVLTSKANVIGKACGGSADNFVVIGQAIENSKPSGGECSHHGYKAA